METLSSSAGTAFSTARERYAALGVDVEAALRTLARTPVSLQCWQGDDVAGFEAPNATLSGGGIQATGTYPGKARTLEELRSDLDRALSLIPGPKRLNLHASYGDFGGRRVDRDAIEFSHYASWVDWCASRRLGMDFNPTCFSHRLANDGATLSHRKPEVRQFWIEHCRAARRVAAEIGAHLGSACVNNVWIPDGAKDTPVDRRGPRLRLIEALDAVFADSFPESHLLDAVESKLFGIGAESYTVGSHEFYLGYAVTRKKLLCLDMGHFHPTESVADKVSAVLAFVPGVLLHVSRGVRWDSDHVVILDDPTRALFEEVVRGGYLDRMHLGLDFFDASINRVAAWVIGTRATQKALLLALLEPSRALREAEEQGDGTSRLTLQEEARSLPFGLVWDEYCRRSEVPVGAAFLTEIQAYEKNTLSKRH